MVPELCWFVRVNVKCGGRAVVSHILALCEDPPWKLRMPCAHNAESSTRRASLPRCGFSSLKSEIERS